MSIIVKTVHTILIAFVVLVPLFSNNELLLTYHFIIVPTIMAHWLTNNNTCALTQLEAFISGKKDTNETFLGKLINPVYAIKDTHIWMIAFVLWLITVFKLQYQHNFALLKIIYATIKTSLGSDKS